MFFKQRLHFSGIFKTLFFLLIFSKTVFSQVPWSMFHACEKHCGIYPQEEYQEFDMVRWKFQTGGKVFSSPAVLDGIAYIGSEDKNLYAIEIASGKQLWKFQTNGAVHSTAAVFNGVVYFGSFDGFYYALDAKSGKEKWRFQTGGEKSFGGVGYFGMKPKDEFHADPWQFFLSSPVLDPSAKEVVVYFGSSDGNLYALKARTGSLLWKFKTQGSIHSTPAVFSGKVIVGSWDANVYAVDAYSGKELWKFQTGMQPGMVGIQASPTVNDGKVFIGARDASLYALDIETGKLVWRSFFDNSWVLSTVGVKDGKVYVTTSDSFEFVALEEGTGRKLYGLRAKGYIYSSPALVGSTAFYGDFTGRFYSVNIEQGKINDQFDTPGRIKGASDVLNERGDLDYQWLGKNKDLTQYQTHLEIMNQYYSLGAIVSSPVLANGVVLFGSADGNLYAVNLKNKKETVDKHHHHDNQ
jgi:eukaryotic-like serine/threonine-protein kinase